MIDETPAVLDEPMPQSGRGRRFGIALIIKGIVSVGLLVALYLKFNLALPSFSSIDPWSVAAASTVLLLQPALIAGRWEQILHIYGSRLKFRELTAITWISVYANQFLPAGIGGDAIRVVFARRRNERVSTAVASVFIDRMMALIALAFLVIIFAPALGNVIDKRALVILGVCCVTGIVLLWLASHWLKNHSGSRLAHRPLVVRALNMTKFVLSVLSDPVRCSFALLLSVIVHVLSAAAFFLIARGLGVEIPWLDLMAIAFVLTFVQIIPISIGGWGLREAASVALFASVGVDAGRAVYSSLFLGVAYLIASLPGAAIWPFWGKDAVPRQ